METLGGTLTGDKNPSSDASACAALSVAFSADRPLEVGSRHALDVDEVLIGRGADRACKRSTSGGRSTLTLRFADPRMSSSHAQLARKDGAWSLRDLHSKNGSRVNGEQVEGALLGEGDVLELGGTFFVFRARHLAVEPRDANADESTAALGVATLHGDLEAALTRLEKVAASTISVVLLGESGTGKEVLARAIHRASGRAGVFQAVNCGALPQTLVEAELFGAKKGAFSGAVTDREGLVRSADGGTLLLDEIGDLPLSSQAGLLRVLQEREVMPVGGTRAVPVDVRVIAATHRDLGALTAAQTFRDDLLARLAGFELRLPPLRERLEDLGTLIRSLLLRLAPDRSREVVFTRRAARALFAYEWPKNVRELEKCLETALVLAGEVPLDLEHLPPAVLGVARSSTSPPTSVDTPAQARLTPQDEERRAWLVKLLEQHQGNLTAVAREIGKARVQVQRWVKRYALRPEDYRQP